MRNLVLLMAVGTLGLLAAGEGRAQWGGCWQPCPIVVYPPCPMIYYPPCPILPCPCPVIYYPCAPVVLGAYPQMMPLDRPAPAARTMVLTSPKRRSYRAVLTNEEGDFEHEVAEPLPEALAAVPHNADNLFRGKVRAAAKLSISAAANKDYPSLSALIATLPGDSDMEQHQPPITKDRNSNRVTEEQRNVTVSTFLYALRKEADNDYHLILGDDPNSEEVRYLNSEVSGLPTGGPFKARLAQVRQDFTGFFKPDILEHARTRYVTFNPPIPVRVSGSLFWDIEHVPPHTVGPSAHKPKTAWEIHPVTKIVFEP